MTFWIDPLKLQKHKFLPLLFWMITFLNVLFVVGCRGKEKKKKVAVTLKELQAEASAN